MIGYEQIKNSLQPLLKNGMVDKVYHSVVILEDPENKNERYPAYRIGDEYYYIGSDDTKIMQAYIRQTGSIDVSKVNQLGACGKKNYKAKILHRMVVFNDYEERNHDDIILELLSFTYHQSIELSKVVVDKNILKRDEALVKNFKFGGNTFYIGIDFYVYVTLNEKCDEEIRCIEEINPIC